MRKKFALAQRKKTRGNPLFSEVGKREGWDESVGEILPVLLEPSAEFKDHKWLSKLQAAPSVNGKLRAMNNFANRVNGWHHVDVALRELIKEAAAKPNRKREEDRLRRK